MIDIFIDRVHTYFVIHIVSTAKAAGSHNVHKQEGRVVSDEIPFLRRAQHQYNNQCKLGYNHPRFLFPLANFWSSTSRDVCLYMYIYFNMHR